MQARRRRTSFKIKESCTQRKFSFKNKIKNSRSVKISSKLRKTILDRNENRESNPFEILQSWQGINNQFQTRLYISNSKNIKEPNIIENVVQERIKKPKSQRTRIPKINRTREGHRWWREERGDHYILRIAPSRSSGCKPTCQSGKTLWFRLISPESSIGERSKRSETLREISSGDKRPSEARDECLGTRPAFYRCRFGSDLGWENGWTDLSTTKSWPLDYMN